MSTATLLSAVSPPLSAHGELVSAVLERTGRPVDSLAVAATLESRGIRDVDARNRYGAQDVFDLAERLYPLCLLESGSATPPADVRTSGRHRRDTGPPIRKRSALALKWYGQGAFKSLPIVLQTAAVILLGYAMWSSLTFDRNLASVVAVATIASFLATGGFVQSISQLSIYYHDEHSYLLARIVSWRLFRLGLVAAVAGAVLGLLVGVVGSSISWSLAGLGVAYYLMLSCLWLLLSILYAMERHFAVIGAFALGTAVVSLTQLLSPVDIVASHLMGLAVAAGAAAAYAAMALRRLERGAEANARLAVLPRTSLLAFGVAPYFGYGILYFVFLFLDRLIAWSVGEHPLAVWLDTPYEYGLDFALLAFVLTLPQLEYSVHRFSSMLVRVQQSFDGMNAAGHNRQFLRFYLRQVGLLAVIGVSGAALMWWGLTALGQTEGVFNLARPGAVTLGVFGWGVVGYLFLALGLMNSIFLFSLSRPGPVLQAMAVAVTADFCVGVILSRQLSYWYAVLGMTAGAVAFALLTGVCAVRVLRRLDYYYYSAY